MSALVRFGRRSAILRAGRWISADAKLETELNAHTSHWFREGLAPRQEKDQERVVAEEMARQFGGRVAARVPTRRKTSERYFLAQRQLAFDFPAS